VHSVSFGTQLLHYPDSQWWALL